MELLAFTEYLTRNIKYTYPDKTSKQKKIKRRTVSTRKRKKGLYERKEK